MKFSYYFSKLIYNFFHDSRIEVIEEICSCKVINSRYYPKFIGYLIQDNIDESKINDLKNILKHHIELKYDNYSYIVKVYHNELPKLIPFEYSPSNDICLGYSYDGKLKLSFNDYTNLIIGGCTGSGKTNLISSILLNLKCDILYIDNKGGADNPLLDVVECITNISGGIEKLYQVNSEIERRLQQLRQNKKTNLKRKVVVIDELYPYLLLPSKEKKEIYALIGMMLSRCRIAKVNFILCSQRLTTEIIPSLLTANCDVRIAMKTASEQESINCIRIPDAFYIKEKGVGIINLNGDVKTFKSMFVDNVSNYAKKENIKNVKIEENKTVSKAVEPISKFL